MFTTIWMMAMSSVALNEHFLHDALQVSGEYGYMRDCPAEKYVRDNLVMPIYDRTNQVLRHFMALDMYAS